MAENLTICTVPETFEHLGLLRKGDCATVTGLATVTGEDQIALRMRLLELGFAPGEQIRVVAESFPRRDPMAVRLGNTTFALRRQEASMIQIRRAVSGVN
jgi:ferrous iron transport protein A